MALLFLAFALFAVGQAAVHRNSTQSAADAAALAAAQEARDELTEGLRGAILVRDVEAIDELLESVEFDSPGACAEARRFAERNDAEVTSCDPVEGGYRVAVVSAKPLGKSDVEGTEDKVARTEATAVVESRCSPAEEEDAEPPPDPEPAPGEDGEGDEDGDDEGENEPPPAPIEFDCDDGPVVINPGQGGPDIDIADFFRVHLRD